jgi:peptidoglycan hydrolase CwlO-like protein
MDLSNLSDWAIILGTLSTGVSTCYLIVRKNIANNESAKRKHDSELLKSAKDNDFVLNNQLEKKISDLENKFNILKENIEKDMTHLKETYQSEIRFLGQKIESLRQEVHDQHGQLVGLLTKMLDRD